MSTTPDDVKPLLDATLLLAAARLDGIESLRIASENRLRQATNDKPDDDGVMRGLGLPPTNPVVIEQGDLVATLKTMEHQATLGLQRVMRAHPLGPWVKATIGIGDKQAARLLACIGDPSWNATEGRFRGVYQLYAYCGLHVVPGDTSDHPPVGQCGLDTHLADADGGVTSLPVGQHGSGTHMPDADGETPSWSDPDLSTHGTHSAGVGVAPRRRRGQKSNWSSDAKMRVYLIATSCIKHARSPYRPVYDNRRQHTALRHPEWDNGHSHNDALRIVSKAILRDLYREAKRIHTGDADHGNVAAAITARQQAEAAAAA